MNTCPAIYQELADTLRKRLAVIGDRTAYQNDPQDHLRRLQEVSGSIIDLQRRLPAPVDPRLTHYLDRCSYDKALAFLEAWVSTV